MMLAFSKALLKPGHCFKRPKTIRLLLTYIGLGIGTSQRHICTPSRDAIEGFKRIAWQPPAHTEWAHFWRRVRTFLNVKDTRLPALGITAPSTRSDLRCGM